MKKIPDLSKIKKIVLAPTAGIGQLRLEVAEILKALGHPEALVTDESMITDFMDFGGSGTDTNKKEAFCKKIAKKVGVPVLRGDYLKDVAYRMRQAKIGGKS